MINFAILAILGSVLMSCTSAPAKSEQRFKTSTMKVYSTTDSFGEIQKKLETTVVTLCNDKGDTISEQITMADSSSIEKILYQYDDNRRLVEKKKVDNDGKESLLCKAVYDSKGQIVCTISKSYYDIDYYCKDSTVYDEFGNVICNLKYDNDILYRKTVNKYDNFNNLIIQTEYGEKGLIERSVYSYDTNGNKEKNIKYNSNEQITEKEEYAYDEQNRVLLSIKYSFDYKFLTYDNKPWEHQIITYYNYDDGGNLIRRYSETGMGSPVTEEIYEYNSNNQLTRLKESVLVEGIKSQTITFYNVNGDVVSVARYDADGLPKNRKETKFNDRNLPVSFEFYESAETLTQLVEVTYEY